MNSGNDSFSQALLQGRSLWIAAKGGSMQPTWQDGSYLKIAPAVFDELRRGDIVFYTVDNRSVAHRLLKKRLTAEGAFFQPKADCGNLPEPWVPAASLIGRVVAIEDQGGILPLHRRTQQLIGLRELTRAAFFSWIFRNRTATHPAAEEPPSARRPLIWGRNIILREHLAVCLDFFNATSCPIILLKGFALLAQGIVDSESRELGDLDLLVPEALALPLVEEMVSSGFRLKGTQSRVRAYLDDQILLEHPKGTLIDLHWKFVTGGWRFRDVIAVDYPGVWRRAKPISVEGRPAQVLSPEDQWLHLCMHLILSGATGTKWWKDLSCLLEKQGDSIDWPVVIERAGQWRVRAIVWLALDTLWQRWQVVVPVSTVRALRPPLWRRWLLRRLLPKNLNEADIREPRIKRHLRELLLMDRLRDCMLLLWRWAHPPQAWHCFRATVSGTKSLNGA